MVLVFISTHASGPNYQGCIVLYDELEFDIQSELKNLRRAMDDVSNRLNSHPIPLIVFSQVSSAPSWRSRYDKVPISLSDAPFGPGPVSVTG